MRSCPEYEEILFLDIHGGLDADSHSRWQSHLKTCPACKEERLRTLRLVGRLKEVMSPPPITQAESAGLVKAVRTALTRQAAPPGRRQPLLWLTRPWRIGPAFATAGVFLVIVSIWGSGAFHSFFSGEPPPLRDLQGVGAEDVAVIQNLDLLKQMEMVEKLVHTLDESEEEIPLPEATSNPQGLAGS